MVTLVGAGPGGRGLLTLAGAEALRQAEVVVYDRLVSEEILALIPEGAELADVGKEQSRHPVPQAEINALLARYAQDGRRVVRLKGGDSFLFGRGGEECEYLKAHGIPFRVIPGVTSALAAPAMAGIPVTHRDFCSSVHIITAHARGNAPLEIDYGSLVRLRGTLVFLMGVTVLPEICAGLLAAGLSPDTPAAVVENGARPHQRKLVSTAAGLPDAAREMGLKSPAVIVVGGVCTLSDTLDWFTPLPLHGRTVIVTRPKTRAGRLSDKLRALGAEVIECPCIETVLRADLSALQEALAVPHDWAVFTSPAGVHLTVQALRQLGRDLRVLYGLRFAAVGCATAEALEAYGLSADLTPEQYDGTHLAEALLHELPEGGAALLLRASGGSPELPGRLAEAGIRVSDVPVYDTVCGAAEAAYLRERLASADAAAFTSASTVRGFMQAAGDCVPSGFAAACIGPQTAKEAAHYGLRVKTAQNATVEALAACVEELFSDGKGETE